MYSSAESSAPIRCGWPVTNGCTAMAMTRGILKAYDFSIQAINLNQAKEGGETSVAFFISLVSSVLGKPVQDRTVVLGDMSVQGMLLKVTSLPERMQLAVEAGARRMLIPSENKRDLADVPDAILTAIQWQFYDSPTRASILAMGLG
jgi:ATP-dependent Lon protease